jgi:hypothetical protein
MPVLPVPGQITSRFLGGYRYEGGHSGTDYAGNNGDPVGSAAAGRVVFTGWAGAYGYRVVVAHGDGTQTTYSHLSRITVQNGQSVKPGQKVGELGSTGNSSGPHLHFEVIQDGRFLNPEQWLAGAQSVAITNPDTGEPLAEPSEPMTQVGIRVTPVFMGDAVDAGVPVIAPVAADSRFAIAAEESRFGAIGGDSRDPQDMPLQGDDINDLGDVQWLQQTGASGASSLDQGSQSARWTGGDEGAIIQQAYDLMRKVGATHEEARMLASFVIPESSGNPSVVNSIGATGLWQVLYPVHKDWLTRKGITQEDLKNPLTNAQAAYQIYRDRGGGHNGYLAWEVYERGTHRQYLR